MSSTDSIDLYALLDSIKSGDGADPAFSRLVEMYSPLMQSRVLEMFGTHDGVEAMQEANIALHSAALTYDRVKCDGVTFGLYASICISNRLRSLLRRMRRDSRYSDRFSGDIGIDTPDTSAVIIQSVQTTPSAMAAKDLCERVMREAKQVLSPFEYEVFRLSLERYTTADISARLSKSAKSVDNAKSRISRKLRENKAVCNILSDIY